MELLGFFIPLWIVWFTLAIILLIAEFMATGIFIIFFSVGSFVAGAFSFMTDNIMLQFVIFIIVSLLGILFGKGFVEKYFNVNKEIKPSTVDAIKGKVGIVTKSISLYERGLVKIDGEEWTAKAVDDIHFTEGERVQVKEIDGVTVIIKKMEGK